MADTRAAKLRRLWLNVHLWIGVGLAALLIPISISGALLVWHDEIDALINPHRYAVTGTQAALPPSVYLARAAEAVAKDPVESARHRGALSGAGLAGARDDAHARPRNRRAAANRDGVPRSARPRLCLDVMEFRSSFFGFLHVFHENLTIPEYSGRQIVGWAGVGMLIMSLTGLWLWWPRGGKLLRALRWKRSTRFTFNLHHLLGFWISIPLAVVSLTGIYLSFPQTARDAMSSVATMNPQPPRGGQTVAHPPSLTADRALEVALKAAPVRRPVRIVPADRSNAANGRSDLAHANRAARGEARHRDGRRSQRSVTCARASSRATARPPGSGGSTKAAIAGRSGPLSCS